MGTERANDLRAFKGFIEDKLSNGGPDLYTGHWRGWGRSGEFFGAVTSSAGHRLPTERSQSSPAPP
jgi:hypothetical protein